MLGAEAMLGWEAKVGRKEVRATVGWCDDKPISHNVVVRVVTRGILGKCLGS